MPLYCYPLQPNFLADASERGSSTVQFRTWQNESLVLPAGSHYGFVWQGTAQLQRASLPTLFPLTAGMYFSLGEAATLHGQGSSGMVVTDGAHQGQFLLGGPIESSGRFAYIDGGTTSLLVAPMTVGDPCLHALYMPPNVDQTVHNHPSDRIGLIIHGAGQCRTPDGDCQSLEPGILFHIPAYQEHKFVTHGRGLHLVVFHPDSDIGFSDRHHPMLNRTLVNDVSATDLPQIQTVL
ncbi:MAG: cupin domain-containing protein [Cyanobacteria bacterium J06627_28]